MSLKVTVLALTSMVWSLSFMYRQTIPPQLVNIEDEFRIGHALAGTSVMILWICYTAIQFPSGRLSDRFGRKAVIVPGVVAYSSGMVLLGLSRSLLDANLAMVLIGLGAGGVFTPTMNLISDTFGEGRGRALGAVFAVGNLAGAMAAPVSLPIVAAASWRWVFLLYSLPGFLTAICFGLLVKGGREAVGRRQPARGLLGALAKPRFLVIVVAIAIFAYAWNGFMTFYPTYLLHTGLSKELTFLAFSILFLVGMLGQITAGVLYGRVSDMKLLGLLSLLCALPVAGTLWNPGVAVYLAVPLGVGLAGYWVISNNALLMSFPPELRGAGFGVASSIFLFSEALGPGGTGYMAEGFSLEWAFGTLVLLFAISAIIGLVGDGVLGHGKK